MNFRILFLLVIGGVLIVGCAGTQTPAQQSNIPQSTPIKTYEKPSEPKYDNEKAVISGVGKETYVNARVVSISGSNNIVHVKAQEIVISGTDSTIYVENSDVSKIIISGTNIVVYIPQGAHPSIVDSGVNTKVKKY